MTGIGLWLGWYHNPLVYSFMTGIAIAPGGPGEGAKERRNSQLLGFEFWKVFGSVTDITRKWCNKKALPGLDQEMVCQPLFTVSRLEIWIDALWVYGDRSLKCSFTHSWGRQKAEEERRHREEEVRKEKKREEEARKAPAAPGSGRFALCKASKWIENDWDSLFRPGPCFSRWRELVTTVGISWKLWTEPALLITTVGATGRGRQAAQVGDESGQRGPVGD